jgi:hypothetical protein
MQLLLDKKEKINWTRNLNDGDKKFGKGTCARKLRKQRYKWKNKAQNTQK